jgi:hypothetical protein
MIKNNPKSISNNVSFFVDSKYTSDDNYTESEKTNSKLCNAYA